MAAFISLLDKLKTIKKTKAGSPESISPRLPPSALTTLSLSSLCPS